MCSKKAEFSHSSLHAHVKSFTDSSDVHEMTHWSRKFLSVKCIYPRNVPQAKFIMSVDCRAAEIQRVGVELASPGIMSRYTNDVTFRQRILLIANSGIRTCT